MENSIRNLFETFDDDFNYNCIESLESLLFENVERFFMKLRYLKSISNYSMVEEKLR